ncbi:MAG: LodA/GoxA family CTQ-dependent oxidase [Ilumatobacteraceae bacterium]
MGRPVVYTRRRFLATTTAAAAALVAGTGVAAGCDDDDASTPTVRTDSPTSPPATAATTSTVPPPTTGPSSTGPASSTPPDPLARVVSVAVHPGVGIARVGNSVDSFYVGPELPGALPHAPSGFKDASGAIARQAARFRIYGYDAAGEVLGEVTAADATITWTVCVANKKAAWYQVDRPMDLPIAAAVARRNEDVTGVDRDGLVISSGERSITGSAAGPVGLDGGQFLGEPVPLGELLTDEHGRLLFVPGEGRGYAPGQAPLTTFSDNDGWADDTCDGPVLATVTWGERTLVALPGWVVVTPPNYGPGLRAGLVTAYDSSRLGWDALPGAAPPASEVSFRDDVLPILGRIVDMQWVNAGYLESNGWHSTADYLAAELLDRLADPSPASADLRRTTFELFRSPYDVTERPDAIPQMYGDGVAFPPASSYHWMTVTPIQHAVLQAWAQGAFVDDRHLPAVTDLDALAPPEQVRALDRAGLDACLGGAYHPGIELPWTLRVASMWTGEGRLRVRAAAVDNVDYGDELAPEQVMAPDGPLAGSGPGDLTRWLGTPWHADAASCRAGHRPEVSSLLPTFWPARIPNHVLREDDYRVVVDTSRPMVDREAAFGRRYDWERFVSAATRPETLANMAAGWSSLGMVTQQPGPADAAFPAVILTETDVGFPTEPAVIWSASWDAMDPMVWDSGQVTTPS